MQWLRTLEVTEIHWKSLTLTIGVSNDRVVIKGDLSLMRREVFLKIRVFFIELRAISTSLDLMEVLQESPSEINGGLARISFWNHSSSGSWHIWNSWSITHTTRRGNTKSSWRMSKNQLTWDLTDIRWFRNMKLKDWSQRY